MMGPMFVRWRAMGLQWIEQREPRERLLLAVLAVVTIVFLYLMLIWRPLQEVRAEAIAEIDGYETLAARLRVAGPEIARRAVRDGRPLSTLITSSAVDYGLAIRRLEPEEGRIRVVLDDADFSSLIEWVDQLEGEHNFRVVHLKLDRRPAPGLVNAQITLAR